MIRICPECGKEFESRHGKKYCSDECIRAVTNRSALLRYHRNKGERTDGVCAVCGKTFERKSGAQKYCSVDCSRQAERERERRIKRVKKHAAMNEEQGKEHIIDDTLKLIKDAGMSYAEWQIQQTLKQVPPILVGIRTW